MLISNTQAIETLKGLVDNEITRYQIITLDTIIGSYKARKNYTQEMQEMNRNLQDFEIGRIVAQRYEAKYIAQQRAQTLNLFKKYITPSEVLKKLQQETKNFELNNLSTHGLYEKLSKFMGSNNSKSMIGERLETRLIGNKTKREKRKINNDSDVYRIKNIFEEEAEEMSAALWYELQNLRED